MSGRRVFLVLVMAGAAMLCAQATAPVAQNEPEMTTSDTPATFTTRVNLVPVPVVVRDRQGHAVGNLKKEDFELFDKGKLQVISRFDMEKAAGAASAANEASGKAPAEGENASNVAAAMPQRYVAYLFDDLNIQFGDLARVQKAATHHVATALQPSDRAAIYTTSGQRNLDFTDDRDKLQQAVMKLRPVPMYSQPANDCPYMTYYLADQIIYKNNSQALSFDVQDTIVCAGLQGPNAQQLAQTMVQTAAQTMIGTGEQGTHIALTVIKDIVRRISALPGQRTIILTSPGFLTVSSTSFEEKTDILDRAAHANVMISALDARGLYTDSDLDASQRGASTVQMQILKSRFSRETDTAQADVLAELADGTGGTFFQNNNDFDAGYKRLAAAPEYVYVLGFSPQDLKMDGTFHKLKITVTGGQGLTVQARRGYYAPKHKGTEEETAKADIQDAVFSREEMHDLPVDLHTQFFKPDPADARLTVLARVDLKHIRFRKVDGRNRNDLTVVAVLFDRNGNYVTGTSKVVEMRLRDETLQKLSSGITVRSNFDVKPGTYMVRLVVRDAQGQMMSAQNGAVDIP